MNVTANEHWENVPVVITRTYRSTVCVAEADWIRSKVGAAETTVKAPPVMSANGSPTALSDDSWSLIVTDVPVKLNTWRYAWKPNDEEPTRRSMDVPFVAVVSERLPGVAW